MKIHLRVAICNTNTVVRSNKDELLCKVINSFDIKTPDGFPIAKSSSIFLKNNQKRVDGYNVFLSTIREGIAKILAIIFMEAKNPLCKIN